MKIIIFTISIILLTTTLGISQPLVQENKTWTSVECINFGSCWNETFKITGDTSIGQVDYKKLYRTYDTTFSYWGIYGAIRESDNQVFIYNFDLESEEILYDFNLSVGDTFSTVVNNLEYYNCPIEIVVSEIDTVLIENNEQRQRFTFAGEQWISGIGSTYGLVFIGVDQCIFDLSFELSCCHENNELIYQSPYLNGCFINSVGLEEKNEEIKHSIYPNPFSEFSELNFDYSSSKTYRLQIINGKGQIIEEIGNIKSGEIVIPGHLLSPGIYFYRLTNNKNEIASGKLIRME